MPAAQKAEQLRGVLHRHVEAARERGGRDERCGARVAAAAGHGARRAVHGDQAIETVRRFVGQRHQNAGIHVSRCHGVSGGSARSPVSGIGARSRRCCTQNRTRARGSLRGRRR